MPTPTIRVELLVDHEVFGRSKRFRLKSRTIETSQSDAPWEAIARAQLAALMIDARKRLAVE